MIISIYSRIRRLQKNLYKRLGYSLANRPALGVEGIADHEPEMLLIGCVDARLDPRKDIGIPHGKALIYRNIAALVAGKDGGAGDRLSVAAALEFAVNSMHVQKIVVMGHTGCGGIAAFLQGDHEETHHIYDYLKPLESVRAEAENKGGNKEKQAREMEKAAVAFSLENLMSYEAVANAVEQGKLQLQGWVIDTGNRLIWEMDPATGDFNPMGAGIKRNTTNK
ncbi:MAG: carbonic anhydrase [Alphaproteobacteria bacterium]|nr:carbonic anhydrase [Alphaproteobacteria bacterium]